jgi:hypothetical protein
MSTYLILRNHARDDRIGETILSLLEDSHDVEKPRGGYRWRTSAPATRAASYNEPRQGLAIPHISALPQVAQHSHKHRRRTVSAIPKLHLTGVKRLGVPA